MLRLAHIVQVGSPCSFRLALHNLDSLDVRTVDLEPHLHRNTRQVVPQQDCPIDLAVDLSNVETNT